MLFSSQVTDAFMNKDPKLTGFHFIAFRHTMRTLVDELYDRRMEQSEKKFQIFFRFSSEDSAVDDHQSFRLSLSIRKCVPLIRKQEKTQRSRK